MPPKSPGNERLSWPVLALLFLLPLAIGLTFQTDSSGNGDGAAYRAGVCFIETEGHIPLARLEWSHPAHLLASWATTRALAFLGWAQDPHYAIHLQNFLALGLLALVLARTWLLHDPDPRRAFLAGLCVAILPGWTWCAQEPLSDVSGHSLVAFSICALLALEIRIRRDRRILAQAFLAAFLASLAFLFRPSAALFAPLFLWLGIEAILLARSKRSILILGFVLGALLPLAAFYVHFLFWYDQKTFLSTHFPELTHNLEFRGFASILGLIKDWFHHSHRGLGTFAFLLSLVGWWIWLLAGDWRPVPNTGRSAPPRRRPAFLRPFGLFTLGLLPYFLFLLGNPAAGRFRFSLPIQLALVLGIVPLMGHLQKYRAGKWLLPAFIPILVAVTLLHSLPLLHIFATRHAFTEAGAIAVTKVATPDDLLLGHQSAPYLQLRQRYRALLAGGWGKKVPHPQEARTHGVRYDGKQDDFDFWDWNWRRSEKEVLEIQKQGGRTFLFNEVGLGGFRQWLGWRGFRERTVATLPAHTLRNRLDPYLGHMDPVDARRLVDLQVLQIVGPTAKLSVQTDEKADLVRMIAKKRAGHRYQLVAGTYAEGHLMYHLGATLPIRTPQDEPEILHAGTLDAKGRAELRLEPPRRVRGEAWILLVLDDSGTSVLSRSPLWFPRPEDDVTPPTAKPWIVPKEEQRLR